MRTPTCVPSTPNVSPSCPRTSSWHGASAASVPEGVRPQTRPIPTAVGGVRPQTHPIPTPGGVRPQTHTLEGGSQTPHSPQTHTWWLVRNQTPPPNPHMGVGQTPNLPHTHTWGSAPRPHSPSQTHTLGGGVRPQTCPKPTAGGGVRPTAYPKPFFGGRKGGEVVDGTFPFIFAPFCTLFALGFSFWSCNIGSWGAREGFVHKISRWGGGCTLCSPPFRCGAAAVPHISTITPIPYIGRVPLCTGPRSPPHSGTQINKALNIH